jgi:hypothetical protein
LAVGSYSSSILDESPEIPRRRKVPFCTIPSIYVVLVDLSSKLQMGICFHAGDDGARYLSPLLFRCRWCMVLQPAVFPAILRRRPAQSVCPSASPPSGCGGTCSPSSHRSLRPLQATESASLYASTGDNSTAKGLTTACKPPSVGLHLLPPSTAAVSINSSHIELATTTLGRHQFGFAYKKVKLSGRICVLEVSWGWV